MLIKKFKANNPETILWGSGRPVREFIHADDVARAFLFLMLNYNSTDIINVGTEEEVSIADLAIKIAVLNGKKSSWKFDETKPDGIARKCLDSSKIRAMGWSPKVSLDEGLRRIYVNQ
jgi:GDP-L-fucose synthase